MVRFKAATEAAAFEARVRECGWPTGRGQNVPADQADLGRLLRAGVTEEWATQQAGIYREVARANPANPTATIRAEWLERIAASLRGGR